MSWRQKRRATASNRTRMNFPYQRFFLQHRDGIERPSAWRGRRYWVVARSLCAFRVFRLPDAERSSLRDFAALKVREWAPYEEVGFHLHLTRDAARVWVWDGARVRDGMLAMGIKPGRFAVLPETAVQERAADGVHLFACLEGFEGQMWSEGELKAGRWWAEMPNPEQWLEFQRAAGVVTRSLDDAPTGSSRSGALGRGQTRVAAGGVASSAEVVKSRSLSPDCCSPVIVIWADR